MTDGTARRIPTDEAATTVGRVRRVGRVGHVRDRATFLALRRSGRRTRAGALTLTWLPDVAGDPAPPRVAYAVGRRIGPAVQRNLIRRRLRVVVAEFVSEMPPGAYLLSLGKATRTPEIGEMRAMMAEALAALGDTSGGRLAPDPMRQ